MVVGLIIDCPHLLLVFVRVGGQGVIGLPLLSDHYDVNLKLNNSSVCIIFWLYVHHHSYTECL